MNSLGRKVLVASLSVLLLLGAAYALVARELGRWDDAAAALMRDARRALLDGQLHEALTRAAGEAASYVLTGNDDYRAEAGEAIRRANAALAMLRQIAGGPAQPGDHAHARFLERHERVLRSTEESVGRAVARVSAPREADLADTLNRIYANEAEADALAQEVVAHHRSEQSTNEQSMRDHSRQAHLLILGVAAAFTVWMGLLIGYVRQRIVTPLTGLAGLTAAVAAGDLSRSVGVTHSDEIGQLQRSYNQMVVELAEQRGQLAALVERLSRARDAAEAANQAKSDFLANVSHEVRTPMNGVMATLDLMHETATSPEQRELADVARGSARSLLKLLNELLDFSRIDAGRLELESLAFDLRQLVTQMVEVHGKRAAAKGLAMTCAIAAEIPAKLHGDPMRLGQVLLNLLDNAIKFTERGSIEVSVTLEAPPPEPAPAPAGVRTDGHPVGLRFRVTDTGVGIAAQAAQWIFQPFYQADGSTTRRYGGVGLGLGIARQLTHMMGGEIGFESEPGKGSSFWFTVRLRAGAECSPAAKDDPPPERRLPAGCPVLLVEDNRDNREVMARILERRGLRVTRAENGRQALARTATEDFDLILMDCQMPEMDGFDATRAIRALPGDRAKAPIVALTAFGLTEQKQRYLDAGFDDLLSKPYTIEQIEELLHRWLVLERVGGKLSRGTGDAAASNP